MPAFEGAVATKVKRLDDIIDVKVSLPEDEQIGHNVVGKLQVANPRGQLINLDQVAEFKKEKGIESYFHTNNEREVSITGEVDTDVTTSSEIVAAIRDKIPDYKKKYPSLNLEFGGEEKDTQESLQSLARAFVFALVLIYFLLILTFQSFAWPLIIISAIPIGVVSVIWALFFHGQPLSFMGMLGGVAPCRGYC